MKIKQIISVFLTCSFLMPGMSFANAADLKSQKANGISLIATLLKQQEDSYQVGEREDVSKKVNEYIEIIRQKVLKDAGIFENDVKNFFNNFIDPFNRKVKEIKITVSLINYFLSGGMNEISKFEGKISAENYKLLQAVLLMSVASGFDKCFHEVIFEIIKNLEGHLTYWKEQKSHPVSYFFHKSPIKWLTTPKQMQEIEKNIEALNNSVNDHFQFIGYLAAYSDTFDSSNEVEKQFEWFGEYLSLMHEGFAKLSRYKNLTDTSHEDSKTNIERFEPEFEKLAAGVQGMLKNTIMEYPSKVDKRITAYKMPGYFTRNWLRNLTLAGITFGAAYYSYKNYEKLPGWWSAFKDSFIMNPYNNVKETFFPSVETAPPSAQHDYTKLGEDIIDGFDRARQNLTNGAPAISDDELGEMYRRTIDEWKSYREAKQFAESDLFNSNDNDYVSQRASNLDRSFIEECLNTITEDMKNIPNDWAIPKGKVDTSLDLLGHLARLVNLEVHLAQRDTKKFGKDTLDEYDTNIKPKINELITSGLQDVNYFKGVLNNLIQEMRAVKALAVSIPAVALLYGVKVVVDRLRSKPDYEPIRSALNEVAALLLGYEFVRPRGMKPEHYGQLLYLVDKLKKEANRIPESLHSQYLADIARLESNMTIDRKLRVIDNMYRRYPFLALTTS